MTPRDFLDAADEFATGPHEGYWRSAVSRGYYAVFHGARELLQQCGFAVPHAETVHMYLIRRLSNSGNPLIRDAGGRIDYLRQQRNFADYDFDRPVSQAKAIDMVQRAADILDLLEDAAKTPGICDEITQAMRTYERDVLREVTWKPPAAP